MVDKEYIQRSYDAGYKLGKDGTHDYRVIDYSVKAETQHSANIAYLSGLFAAIEDRE